MPDTLVSTVDAVMDAIRRPSSVNILVNGNKVLADELSRILKNRRVNNPQAFIRVWWIETGDKAHAWNQYIKHIWRQEQLAIFVDGYACPHPSALSLLEEGVVFCDRVLLSTGLPGSGRSAKKISIVLLETHGIHGNLYCIKSSAMSYMKKVGFHLPLGMYRTDSTIGSAIKFGLDPEKNEWDMKRIFVHPEVTWTVKKNLWRYSSLKGHLKRLIRQAQGKFENRAVRYFYQIRKQKIETLPKTTLELVDTWIAACPDDAARLLRSPLCRYTLVSLRKSKIVEPHEEKPILIYESVSN